MKKRAPMNETFVGISSDNDRPKVIRLMKLYG